MNRVRLAPLLALALLGCGRASDEAPADGNSAGAQLERAAIGMGVVPDPKRLDPAGAYGSETDRVCVLRAGGGYRIGESVDYGEGNGCVARGTARGVGRLAVSLGEGCRFEARFDGSRLVFPAILPAGCDSMCTGRASLTALVAGKLSGAESEAAALRAPDGQPLCSGS